MKTWRECLILRKHISQLRIANHQIFGEIQHHSPNLCRVTSTWLAANAAKDYPEK